MLKKWVSLILIVTMSVTILGTGCSNNKSSEEQGKSNSSQSQSTANTSGDKTLTICDFSSLDTLNQTVLSNFKKIHSDIKVEEQALSMDNYESFQQKLETDLASGQGPDIISLPTWYISTNYKLMQKDLLCDLNPLVSEDNELKIENYNDKVMNAGVYNGKRYFIPVDYCFSYFYTYNTILGKYKIDTTKWTWDDLIKIAKNYCNDENRTSKYFFDSKFNFWDYEYSIKDSFVDYNKKTSNFNSEKFIKLLNTYKELLPYVCPSEEENKVAEYEKILKLSVLHTENYTGVVKNNTGDNKVFNDEPIYIPYPTFDGDKSVTAFATNVVAITSKCKYKKEAFDYIKVILSKAMQDGEMLNAPVMNSVFEEQSKTFKPTSESPTSITNIFEKIKGCTLGDGSVDDIIRTELPNFIDGKSTAEQTAKAIDEKVQTYLNK